jgi:hypothetical protein
LLDVQGRAGDLSRCYGGGIQTKEPFVGNHLWVVGVTDPDGYRIDFESPTDVPEETKLAEWTGEVKGS